MPTHLTVSKIREERSACRTAARQEALKNPPKHHMPFIELSNWELRNLIEEHFGKLPHSIYDEIDEQDVRRGGAETRGSQMHFLNRYDLLRIIYSLKTSEINRIDNTPIEDVPLLLNEQWSCPQLTERVKWRLANGI